MDNNRNKLAWIMLTLYFNAPSAALWQTLENYSCAEELYEDIANRRCGYLSDKELAAADAVDESGAMAVIRSCQRKGIEIITFDDKLYPERLRRLSCPPAVLYCKGDVTSLSSARSAAVIGARNASDYSLNVAEVFSHALAKCGITVISGIANGIDHAAQAAVVKAGGTTCAVLGCGIEYDYPKGSKRLKDAICAHGALVSEYFPETHPRPEYFKVRNRIVSGLSDGILVVQAGRKSGTLNTVGHALEQAKDVYVIPAHDIFSDEYTGQSELIRDGAIEVTDPKQLIDHLSDNSFC